MTCSSARPQTTPVRSTTHAREATRTSALAGHWRPATPLLASCARCAGCGQTRAVHLKRGRTGFGRAAWAFASISYPRAGRPLTPPDTASQTSLRRRPQTTRAPPRPAPRPARRNRRHRQCRLPHPPARHGPTRRSCATPSPSAATCTSPPPPPLTPPGRTASSARESWSGGWPAAGGWVAAAASTAALAPCDPQSTLAAGPVHSSHSMQSLRCLEGTRAAVSRARWSATSAPAVRWGEHTG
jgi:hypothetical protein